MKRIITFIVALFALTACGANMLSLAEQDDPAQEAITAMEKNKPEEAVTILEDALESDPNNALLLSLLSSAIAQKFGFDPLTFAFNLAQQQSSDESSGDGITAMFGALPNADDETVAGIQLAIATLERIPAADRTEEDNFKLSLLHTANMSLVTKKIGSALDGEFDVEDLQNMSEDDAAEILSALLNASDALIAAGADGENSAKAKEEIDSIKSEIDAQEGTTDAEKLKNYFAAQNPAP